MCLEMFKPLSMATNKFEDLCTWYIMKLETSIIFATTLDSKKKYRLSLDTYHNHIFIQYINIYSR